MRLSETRRCGCGLMEHPQGGIQHFMIRYREEGRKGGKGKEGGRDKSEKMTRAREAGRERSQKRHYKRGAESRKEGGRERTTAQARELLHGTARHCWCGL